ncbi:MAG TPA: hypothetical protein VGO64_07660, partial [Candidatus Limnocylindrales bacterium]|nr:hypothetical protein [Candidatus Limnocylindrales bacterium]
MDAARTSDDTPGVGDDTLRAWRADAPPPGSPVVHDIRIDDLRAEASKAVTHGANTLRAVIQRYRVAYADELSRWQALRDDLDAAERYRRDRRPDDGTSPVALERDDDARAENDRIRMLQLDFEALGRE